MRAIATLAATLATVVAALTGVPRAARAAAPPTIDPAEAAPASESGADLGQQTLDWATNFEQNIAVPLQDGTHLMTTPSGKDLAVTPQGETIASPPDLSFSAQVHSVPASTVALEMFIQMAPPVAAGSDSAGIRLLRISQDIDFDGSFDTLFEYPPGGTGDPISGVCADGFIVCAPDTWTNCLGYRWHANPDGVLSVESAALVGPDALKSCFCINGGCDNTGITSASSQQRILRILSQGAIRAVQSQRPAWSFTEKDVTPPTAQYYGAELDEATVRTQTGTDPSSGAPIEGDMSVAASGFLDEAKTWRDNPDAMTAQSETELAPQLSTPGSTAVLMESAYNDRRDSVVRSCSIMVNYSVEYVDRSKILSVGTHTWGFLADGVNPSTMSAYIHLQTDNWGGPYPATLSLSANVETPSGLASVSLHGDLEGTHEVRIDGTTVATFTPTGAPGTSYDLTSYFTGLAAGNHTIEIVRTTGTGPETIVLAFTMTEQCLVTDTSTNTCSALESNPDCVLEREEQDTVVTVEGGVPTGLSPTPTTRRFGTGPCTRRETAPAWVTKRTYRCSNPCPGGECFDYSQAVEVSRAAGENIDPDASSATYDMVYRVNDDPTSPTLGSSTLSLDLSSYPAPDPDDCTKICKTVSDETNTDLTTEGPSDNMTQTSLEVEYHVYECQGPDQTICPAPPGETIVVDCSCETGFEQVAAKVQALNEAREEVICSDGVRK